MTDMSDKSRAARLCVTCAHSRKIGFYEDTDDEYVFRCARNAPPPVYSPVTGNALPQDLPQCVHERLHDYMCGPEGRYWQSRCETVAN